MSGWMVANKQWQVLFLDFVAKIEIFTFNTNDEVGWRAEKRLDGPKSSFIQLEGE